MLMSDHGQTPSVPFRHLYGKTLEETLSGMLGGTGESPDVVRRSFSPDASYTLSLLAGLEEIDDGQLGWLARRSRRALARLAPGQPGGAADGPGRARAVVCVSGSLAHIYFTGSRESLTLEDVIALYPGLVEKLARHPGIGFVAARRRFGDAVAICEDGIRNLVTGQRSEGNDPLAPYGRRDLWAGELLRLLSYPDSGDLVVNGAWLSDRRRIVVMEEQASSHGGPGRPADRAVRGGAVVVDGDPAGSGIARGAAPIGEPRAGACTGSAGTAGALSAERAARQRVAGGGIPVGGLHPPLASGGGAPYICASFARSSNGRTADSGSVDGGSSPPRATTLANDFGPN